MLPTKGSHRVITRPGPIRHSLMAARGTIVTAMCPCEWSPSQRPTRSWPAKTEAATYPYDAMPATVPPLNTRASMMGEAALYWRYRWSRMARKRSKGCSMRMGALQAGHLNPPLDRVPEVSISAIHCSMQSSCASRLHGHGFTHVALGVSVSFWRQMKQTCWSAVAMGAGTMTWLEAGVDSTGDAASLAGVAISVERGGRRG